MSEEKRALYTLNHLRDRSKEDWQGGSDERPKLVSISSVRDQARIFERPNCKIVN